MNWTESQYKQYRDRQRQDEPESVLQKHIVEYCLVRGWPCHAHNQSQYYYRVHNRGEGWMDVEIKMPKGRTVNLELKSKKGEMRKAQTMLQNQCRILGHEYYKIKTWKEFLEIVK